MVVKSLKSKNGNAQNTERSTLLMLGYLCIANEAEASLVRKVQILDRFELLDADIGQICGCSTQSVKNARLLGKKIKNDKKK